jgi:hypothetical protein
VRTIAASTENDGSYSWTIPTDVAAATLDWNVDDFLPRDSGGGGIVSDGIPFWTGPLDPLSVGVYTIKVSTLDGSVESSSGLFVIGSL